MRRSAVALLVLAACAGGSGAEPRAARPTEAPSTAAPEARTCPELPRGPLDPATAGLWPGPDAAGLVPDIPGTCATPTSPFLFGLLNENALWGGEFSAAALGVLHDGEEALATFSVLDLERVSADFGDALKRAGGVVAEAGGTRFAWAAAGDAVTVLWAGGERVIALSGANATAASYAATLWRTAQGEPAPLAPEDVPSINALPPAIAAGAPTDSLPEGYSAAGFAPGAFLGSDFADAVTIHDEDLEALGAAVVWDSRGTVVGTIVAARGSDTLNRQARGMEKDAASAGTSVAAAGVEAGDVDALIVGYEDRAVDTLAAAWEEELGS
ncbi:MAG TPA: hypothetical protein VG318_07645 [Actinomycetota bacterium]|nr:hypothetical protein [Actinomycetota bacterium]